MEEETGDHSTHQTCPPIHGHGGKFLLHGGVLENLTGDDDVDRPPAGMSSDELDKQQRFSGDEFVTDDDEPSTPRAMEHSPGRGGNFHLHGGQLEHVIGDEDDKMRLRAGMSSQGQGEGQDKHGYCEHVIGTEQKPTSPRPMEHSPGRGGNFHLHGGHLEHVIGDEDGAPLPAAGMRTSELDRDSHEENENPVTVKVDSETTLPLDHVPGHGGNFHLHGGQLEHVIGDEDDKTRPAAGMSSEWEDQHKHGCWDSDAIGTDQKPVSPRALEHSPGRGGNFHLHGGELEHVIGDEDNASHPAAGMTTSELDRDRQEEEPITPTIDSETARPLDHVSGHGGNFQLHGGQLEHVIGDEDKETRPGAGIISQGEHNDKNECSGNNVIGTEQEPAIPRAMEHCPGAIILGGRDGNSHLHGGHLEHIVGDEDDVGHPAAGMITSELDRNQQEENENPVAATVDSETARPLDHVSGHGGNFHLHGGQLEHVIGDEDSENPPAAGMPTAELSKLH